MQLGPWVATTTTGAAGRRRLQPAVPRGLLPLPAAASVDAPMLHPGCCCRGGLGVQRGPWVNTTTTGATCKPPVPLAASGGMLVLPAASTLRKPTKASP